MIKLWFYSHLKREHVFGFSNTFLKVKAKRAFHAETNLSLLIVKNKNTLERLYFLNAHATKN